MISEVLGFTLTRTLPDGVLSGVLTGAYKIYGGVVRDHSGQIVAHLVKTAGNFSPVGTLNTVLEGVNALQLQRIGARVADIQNSVERLRVATEHVTRLATGTVVLSGLTLAVSAAGFLFLHKKLGQIDKTLQAIAKDSKWTRDFLARQERARLSSALKTLSQVESAPDAETRRGLLLGSRQTLAELYENYAEQLNGVGRLEEVVCVEEYFVVIALGLAACSAELDMRTQACRDLQDAYRTWDGNVKRIAKLLFRGEAQRFMEPRYATVVRTDEVIDWLDYVHEATRQIEWIDDLRKAGPWLRVPSSAASKSELAEVDLMRKLVSRHRVLQGYKAGYEFLEECKMRPSALQSVFDAVPANHRVQGCLLLVREPEQVPA